MPENIEIRFGRQTKIPFFYLGEQSGSFNVWKLPLVDAGKAAAEQITHFEKNPIRFLSIDQAGDLCFGYDGEIYLLPRGATDPSKVNIQIAAAANTFKQQLHLNEGVTEIALSPNGKEIAFVIRGGRLVIRMSPAWSMALTGTRFPKRSAGR
jgi:tricorn protease